MMAHVESTAPAVELADVPIVVAQPTAQPVVYRCAQRWPAHYYRETAPGRWETALGPDFECPVRIPDLSRAEIEARGHVLVPLPGGEVR